jgi:hypothetical protein
MQREPLTVIVPRGTKVNVKEVDSMKNEDSRAGDDGDALIIGGESLKITVKKMPAGNSPSAKAAYMTMCG